MKLFKDMPSPVTERLKALKEEMRQKAIEHSQLMVTHNKELISSLSALAGSEGVNNIIKMAQKLVDKHEEILGIVDSKNAALQEDEKAEEGEANTYK